MVDVVNYTTCSYVGIKVLNVFIDSFNVMYIVIVIQATFTSYVTMATNARISSIQGSYPIATVEKGTLNKGHNTLILTVL